ncbi:MAG: DUF1214 domain-containing protein [Halieaceae bacterium]|nr:DUF1214 domain-containing protein [Halieaceae bacterium]MCP5166848.1 DUF1214 domain-containing protein [Pseudomonadales bacterium]
MKFNGLVAAAAFVVSAFLASSAFAEKTPIKVNVDNFARAQADHEFAGFAKRAGGTNKFMINRSPTPIDDQNVIRMNRDTLYSLAVVNISRGATVTMPDAGKRYMSLMIINNDGYVNDVYYGSGTYELTTEKFDTPFVGVVVRILVNAEDPADVAVVNKLQDQVKIEAVAQDPFVMPNYDEASFKATLEPILALSKGLQRVTEGFGSKSEVNPVHFLLASAAGWGGLPEKDSIYLNVEPGLPVGKYELTVKDVPVKGFWSISLYDSKGYFKENALHAYSLNNLTAKPNADGSYTIRFGGCTATTENCLPIMEGWNYLVRMYRPDQQVIDGKWVFPGPPVPRAD